MKYKINRKHDGPIYITESDELKMNANCPDSEKTGSGPGSCGGGRSKSVKSENNPRRSTSRLPEYTNKPVMTEQTALNRFVVTSNDGKKYSFRDKDFATLALNRLSENKPIDDIVKRHDELYKKIDSRPKDYGVNPETGLETRGAGVSEKEFVTENGNKFWRRTDRAMRQASIK